MKPNTVYIVQVNLSGLHRCVYTLRWNKELNSYYDSTGNIDYIPVNVEFSGRKQLVFNNKKDAENALKGAEMVADFVGNMLSHK